MLIHKKYMSVLKKLDCIPRFFLRSSKHENIIIWLNFTDRTCRDRHNQSDFQIFVNIFESNSV